MSETDYDLDASIRRAWQEFVARLGEVISIIDEDDQLTISSMSGASDQSPTIWFRGLAGRRLLAQASSNASLDEQHQLNTSQLAAMTELGWQAPTTIGEFPSRDFTIMVSCDDSEQLAALAATTFQEVYGVEHPVFLEPDQLSELLQPMPENINMTMDYAPRSLVAVMPVDQRHLDQLLDEEMVDIYGNRPFRDVDGDIAIRVGSTMVFVRSTPDAREVLLFSVLVHDVAGRSRAAEVLNDLNVEARFGRFALHRDRVFVQMSVMAQPFVPAHLRQALNTISQLADGIDDELAAMLQGRTTFNQSDC